MKIKSTLPVFTGFYNTLFSCDCEESYIDEGKTYDDYEWNYDDYHNRVAKACVSSIQSAIKDVLGFDITVVFEAVYSPKYYNYTNDAINVTFELNTETYSQIVKELYTWRGDFEGSLEEDFTSRDGFISFYSNKFVEWLGYLIEQDESKMAVVFQYILEFLLNVNDFDSVSLYETENVSNETNFIEYKEK